MLIIFFIFSVRQSFFSVFVILFTHTHTHTFLKSFTFWRFLPSLINIYRHPKSLYSQVCGYWLSLFLRLKSFLGIFNSLSFPPHNFNHVVPESCGSFAMRHQIWPAVGSLHGKLIDPSYLGNSALSSTLRT